MKAYSCFTSQIELVSPSIDEMIAYNSKQAIKFHVKFFNTVVKLAQKHGCNDFLPTDLGAKFSFRQIGNLIDTADFVNVLDCFLSQLERGQTLSIDMGDQTSEKISCRICADYGTCYKTEPTDEINLLPSLSSIDRIRIKVVAEGNTIIVGHEFYKAAKTLPQVLKRYHFESKGEIIIEKIPYPVYQVLKI